MKVECPICGHKFWAQELAHHSIWQVICPRCEAHIVFR